MAAIVGEELLASEAAVGAEAGAAEGGQLKDNFNTQEVVMEEQIIVLTLLVLRVSVINRVLLQNIVV